MGLFPEECTKCGKWFNRYLGYEELECPHQLTREGLKDKALEELDKVWNTEERAVIERHKWAKIYIREVYFNYKDYRGDEDDTDPYGYIVPPTMVKREEKFRTERGLPQLVDYTKTYLYEKAIKENDTEYLKKIEDC